VIVALHGFTGGGGDFAPLREALPEYSWVTPTLPGHSPNPAIAGVASDDCSVAASLRYLNSIIPEQSAEPIVLLGYSLGARLALRYALSHPTRISALVLIAASPGIGDAGERQARQKEDNALAQKILDDGVPAFLVEWQRRPIIATQAHLPAAWRSAMQQQRHHLRAEGLAASLRQFGQGAVLPIWDKLAELSLPVLLCAGMEDEKYVEFAQAMHARILQSKILLIPEAGHLAHLENLPAFVAGLREFLQQNGLPSASSM